MKRWSCSLPVLLILCGAAQAADDAVVVTALRHPVSKSYERMVAGMELFEQRRHLAPGTRAGSSGRLKLR